MSTNNEVITAIMEYVNTAVHKHSAELPSTQAVLAFKDEVASELHRYVMTHEQDQLTLLLDGDSDMKAYADTWPM